MYADNYSPYTATLELFNTYLTAHPNTWKPTLPPNWWTWIAWGGTYTSAVARMSLPTGAYGEMGLSTHMPYSNVQ